MDINDPLETLFFLGRRGTKSTMISMVTAYTLYLLLRHETPQEYFKIIKQSEIGIAIVSNNKGNASKQLRETSNMVYGSKWFQPFLVTKDPASEGFYLRTRRGITHPEERIGKIVVSVFAASPSVRGSANIVVILDEYAHFIDSDKSTKRDPLDEKVYDAATPSVAGFIDEHNNALGKVFIATSPNGKKGNSYKKYKSSFGDSSVLMLHMPSNWVNPNMSTQFIRKKYDEDESVCAQEYWAEFIDAKHGFIKVEGKVRACEDINIPNIKKSTNKFQHFMAIDQALSTDSFSFAVVHFDPYYVRELAEDSEYKMYFPLEGPNPTYVVDYVGSLSPTDTESLDIDMVIDEVEVIFRAFNVRRGGYDQWSRKFMEREFKRKGLMKRMEFMEASQTTNTEWAKMFKRFINQSMIVWSPFSMDAYDRSFSDEVLSLEEVIGSNHIKVEAPSGLHDDRYSAVTKALYLCMSDDRVKRMTEPNTRKSFRKNSGILKQRSHRSISGNNKVV